MTLPCALESLSAPACVVFLNGTDSLCSPNRKGERLEALAAFRPFLLLVRGGRGRAGRIGVASAGRQGFVLVLPVAGRCREGDAVAVGADPEVDVGAFDRHRDRAVEALGAR